MNFIVERKRKGILLGRIIIIIIIIIIITSRMKRELDCLFPPLKLYFCAPLKPTFSACGIVLGKPSRMKPPLQSGRVKFSRMIPTTISSETSSPLSMTLFAFFPISLPAATAARSMSLGRVDRSGEERRGHARKGKARGREQKFGQQLFPPMNVFAFYLTSCCQVAKRIFL